jgi:hypothetical protein
MRIEEYKRIRAAVIAAGYAGDIEWSQNVKPPATAEIFARETIFVICNSGMKWTVARPIFDRIWRVIQHCPQWLTQEEIEKTIKPLFGHKGKVRAIAFVWRYRGKKFQYFNMAGDKLEYLESLPWIGPITKYHLAKNFGVDCAKPDRHLERIAAHYGKTVHDLCFSISHFHGDRIATVDVVLWRASALGIIKTKEL